MTTSYTISTKKLSSIVKLHKCGFTVPAISKIVGLSVAVINRNTRVISNFQPKSHRRINQTELEAMITMRNRGDTLQAIANVLNRSQPTVYRHTMHIVNDRRRNRDARMNTKTGAVSHFYANV